VSCPGAAKGADDLIANGHNVAVIKYHVVDSLANSFSYARVNDYYQFLGLPVAKFDGILTHIGASPYISSYQDYLPYVNQRNTVLSDFTIVPEIQQLSTNQYRLTASIENVGGYAGTNIVMQVAVTESNLDIVWGLSDKVNSVLRLMVPNANGTPLNFSGGVSQTIQLDFALQDYWDEEHCKLIVFIQDNTTKEVLQTTQLTFQPEALQAGFDTDVQEGCPGLTVAFNDFSSGPVTSWSWTFEGGEPLTSNEQNPIVTFANTGNFNVALTVSNGTNSNTVEVENYITIFELPEVTMASIEIQCINWPAFELTQGSPQGGEYSGPGVANGMFDPALAGIGAHLITYTYAGSNDCENSAQIEVVVDACTGLTESFPKSTLEIYPNPTTSNSTITFSLNQNRTVNISIFNVDGKFVGELANESFTTGKHQVQMDLNELRPGVYFVSFNDGDNVLTKKVTVIR